MTEVATKEKITEKAVSATKKTPIKKDQPFSVLETGGKQYKVSVGQVIKIEKLLGTDVVKGEPKEGDKISFDKILLTDDGKTTKIGAPYLDGEKVEAEIIKIDRAKKVVVVKYKAKSRYHKKRGHRQPYFQIKISKI